MNKSLLSFILFFYFSCFYQPAINKNYNFKKVQLIEVLSINDFKGIVGSGEMIETSLDYNFLNLPYLKKIFETDGILKKILELSQEDFLLLFHNNNKDKLG